MKNYLKKNAKIWIELIFNLSPEKILLCFHTLIMTEPTLTATSLLLNYCPGDLQAGDIVGTLSVTGPEPAYAVFFEGRPGETFSFDGYTELQNGSISLPLPPGEDPPTLVLTEDGANYFNSLGFDECTEYVFEFGIPEAVLYEQTATITICSKPKLTDEEIKDTTNYWETVLSGDLC